MKLAILFVVEKRGIVRIDVLHELCTELLR